MQQFSDLSYEIFAIDDLYSDAEIKEFKDYVEYASDDNRTFTNSPFKNGKVIHEDFSNLMYSRIVKYLPEKYTDRKGVNWQYLQAPKYIMYAKVQSGQQFGLHTDTGCEYDKEKNKYSKYTVLTYLNDDFDGGSTIFYDDNFHETCTVIPKINRTLIFDINLFHRGAPVLERAKYWIGTELVCKLCD